MRAPRVIFTDPQVAAVGLTLQGARDRAINASAYDVATSDTAGASFRGRNTRGTSRIVVDEDRNVIIGATFTGTEVAEWLQAATIALVSDSSSAAARSRAGISHAQRSLAQAARAIEHAEPKPVTGRIAGRARR